MKNVDSETKTLNLQDDLARALVLTSLLAKQREIEAQLYKNKDLTADEIARYQMQWNIIAPMVTEIMQLG